MKQHLFLEMMKKEQIMINLDLQKDLEQDLKVLIFQILCMAVLILKIFFQIFSVVEDSDIGKLKQGAQIYIMI